MEPEIQSAENAANITAQKSSKVPSPDTSVGTVEHALDTAFSLHPDWVKSTIRAMGAKIEHHLYVDPRERDDDRLRRYADAIVGSISDIEEDDRMDD